MSSKFFVAKETVEALPQTGRLTAYLKEGSVIPSLGRVVSIEGIGSFKVTSVEGAMMELTLLPPEEFPSEGSVPFIA